MSMKGLFKSFFSSEEEKTIRELNHPRDLNQNDIIKFRFSAQSELSNKRFQISNVNTYDFEDRKLTEFTLSGDNKEPIYLIIDETGDEPFLSISRKIQRNIVEQLFDLEEFSQIFDSEAHTSLKRLNNLQSLEGWTTESYIQEIYAEGGYFHKGDYRNKLVPQNEDAGEYFDYYLAIDDTRQFVIEAEVYDGGETDVLITIRRPLTDIEEMWPSEAS